MSPAIVSRQAGLTLIEVMIAVALFSLIGLAGFTLVQSIIGVEERTDHRLDELSDLQRAMHILTSDFEQAEPGTLQFDKNAVAFHRDSGRAGEAALTVEYELKDGSLRRSVGMPDGQVKIQGLVGDVGAIEWRFLLPSSGWVEGLPSGSDDDAKPVAIALDITLSGEDLGHNGVLRRVVALPRAPRL